MDGLFHLHGSSLRSSPLSYCDGVQSWLMCPIPDELMNQRTCEGPFLSKGKSFGFLFPPFFSLCSPSYGQAPEPNTYKASTRLLQFQEHRAQSPTPGLDAGIIPPLTSALSEPPEPPQHTGNCQRTGSENTPWEDFELTAPRQVHTGETCQWSDHRESRNLSLQTGKR